MDLRSHEGGAVMLSSQYVQKEKQKNFFLLPNALFDIELHIYAVAIYAYLIRIEDRNTYQCIVSYSTIAKKLGIAPNTVAKYDTHPYACHLCQPTHRVYNGLPD